MRHRTKSEKRIKALDKAIRHINKAYNKQKAPLVRERDQLLEDVERYYAGRYIARHYHKSGFNFDTTTTGKGKAVLAKYGLADDFFDEKYIAYTPEEEFCMICGTKSHIVNAMSIGIAPRFAVCYKHQDFLDIAHTLRVKDISKRPKNIVRYWDHPVKRK